MRYRVYYHWRRFWARYNGPAGFGRIAARLATWHTAPYHGRAFLADFSPRGFIAPTAHLLYPRLTLGRSVFVGDRVVLSVGDDRPGKVAFEDGVQLYGDTFLQTGSDASLRVGRGTHIQPGCHFRAFLQPIQIGEGCEIASGCAFYSFEHGIAAGSAIMEQPLSSKGPIRIGDGAWLGHGVTVLSGVTVGEGAVVGAGSVVTRDIPAHAIAAGTPARVIRQRRSTS